MRSFHAATAAAALAVSVLVAGTLAAPTYADPQRPGLPSAASDRAERALQLAQDVLAGVDRSIEPTLALRELFLLREQLAGDDRERADRLLARPDGQSPGSDPEAGQISWKPWQEAVPVCSRVVCVHYVRWGEHAATYRQARVTRDAVTYAWRREVGDLRYRAPRRDGARGNRRGYPATRGKLDVYLAELSGLGAFGYASAEAEPAATDDGRSSTATGYLVLDQDFAEYGCPSPAGCRRVTAAHELFHLVQYGYSLMGPGATWFLESTATWMEERVHDGVNDNRSYVRYGQLGAPAVPLHYSYAQGSAHRQRPYGNWLVHEFYTRRLGNVVVRRAWYEAWRGRSWRGAMGRALRSAGWSWPGMYAAFASGNNYPMRTYTEGRAYRSVAASPATRTRDRVTLRPYSSRSYRFFSKDTLLRRSGPRLTIEVDLRPGTHHRAYAVLQTYGDGVRRRVIRLDAQGDGTRTFAFGDDEVHHVTLTLVNSSGRSAGAAFTARS